MPTVDLNMEVEDASVAWDSEADCRFWRAPSASTFNPNDHETDKPNGAPVTVSY